MIFQAVELNMRRTPSGRVVFVEADDIEAVKAAFPERDGFQGWAVSLVEALPLAEAAAREEVFRENLRQALTAAPDCKIVAVSPPTIPEFALAMRSPNCPVHGVTEGVQVNHLRVCSMCHAQHEYRLQHGESPEETWIELKREGKPIPDGLERICDKQYLEKWKHVGPSAADEPTVVEAIRGGL